jgi:NOL1/NOP2/fmu family ribosome biogenesis protein
MHGLQFYPHEVRGEGYYISVLRNSDEGNAIIPARKSRINNKPPSFAGDFLAQPDAFAYYTKNEELFAFPVELYADMIMLLENLHVKQAGLRMGTMIKDELIPSHALALSTARRGGIATADLDLQDALTYLKCGIPALLQIPRGWRLATYKKHSLGWMKGLGNRVNNYYPKEYRILMD